MFKVKGKQNKNLLLTAVAVLLLILSGAIVWSAGFKNKNNPNIPQVLLPKIIGKANLTVDFGDGSKRTFEGDIIGNEILSDVLSQAAQAGNFSYKLDEKNNLVSIGKSINNGKRSWHWYINGKKINEQSNKTIVKTDDKILIRYE